MKPDNVRVLEGEALARLYRRRVMPFWAPIMRETWVDGFVGLAGRLDCFSTSVYALLWVGGWGGEGMNADVLLVLGSAQAIENGCDIHHAMLGM